MNYRRHAGVGFMQVRIIKCTNTNMTKQEQNMSLYTVN